MSGGSRTPMLLLLTGLAASLGLNCYLLLGRAGADPGGKRRAASPVPRAGKATGGAAGERCCQALHACQLRRWQQVARTLREGLGRRAGSGEEEARGRKHPAAAAVDAEERAQREALCQVAREHLRRDWARQRDKLTASLKRSLSDPDETEKDARQIAERFGRALGLGEAERETLERRYAAVRGQWIGQILQALGQEPPDLAAVFDAAHGLFADEDRLIRELFGEAAVETIRDAERRSRTVVMALAATLADMPWDDRLRW